MRKSNGVRVHYEKRSDEVRVDHEKKSDEVTVDHKKRRGGVRVHHERKSDGVSISKHYQVNLDLDDLKEARYPRLTQRLTGRDVFPVLLS